MFDGLTADTARAYLYRERAKKMLAARLERKLALIAHMGGECFRCRNDELHPDAYHLHHRYHRSQYTYTLSPNSIDLTKYAHKGIHWDRRYDADYVFDEKYESIVEELKNCWLLCANCHADEHARQNMTVRNALLIRGWL